jgi:transposase
MIYRGHEKRSAARLDGKDKSLMEKILAAGKIRHKFAVRIQTVLYRAGGKGTGEIVKLPGIHPMTVSLYVRCYNQGGIDALVRNKTCKPGKAPLSEEKKQEICRTVCREKPRDETPWSTRRLRKRAGVGYDAVNRILRKRGIKPHLAETFRFGRDPDFERRLKDAAGL